jgi:hypothetical protein
VGLLGRTSWTATEPAASLAQIGSGCGSFDRLILTRQQPVDDFLAAASTASSSPTWAAVSIHERRPAADG